MRYLKAFGRFWYDFVVGDDWRVLVVVVAGIGCVALIAHRWFDAWWLLPALITAALAVSVTRDAR
jgi:hypothetical protein